MATLSTNKDLSLPNVWENDAVSIAAIERNRIVHPKCVPVTTINTPTTTATSITETQVTISRVSLALDSLGFMSLHQPLPKKHYNEQKTGQTIQDAVPGSLVTFNAAISSNERPERVVVPTQNLKETGLADLCILCPSRPATEEELLRVHEKSHVDKMLSCVTCEPCHILDVCRSFNTVFMNQFSVTSALHAAGSTIDATKMVLSNEADHAVCVIRPPGHHSEGACAMGFGLFNSVGIAAAHALETVERVLIVDWDIHHGNGTQEMFVKNSNVCYISAHSLYAFPAFARDDQIDKQIPTYVGEGNAKGTTINCAWTGVNYGDVEYCYLFDQLIVPVAKEFNPSLIIVSAGFDSAAGDEMGYSVTPTGYGKLLKRLKNIGRVVVVMEGGYNIPALTHGIHACVAELLSIRVEENDDSEEDEPCDEALNNINATIDAQKLYWNCLN
jgi:acetoin utilization deacetylase AcuC-like enzyme